MSNLAFPVGVRPLLFAEAEARRALETEVVTRLGRAGYREIVVPIVDFIEPYGEVMTAEAGRRAYRFADRTGDIVAVRSDFTPIVARTLAPWIRREGRDAKLPLRVFYRGDVIRCESSRLGRDREYFQIGAEVVGATGEESDVEAIRLAAELVASAGAGPTVTLGHAGIYRDLVGQASDSTAVRERLLEVLASKDRAALAGLRESVREEDFDLFARSVDGSIAGEELAARCGPAVERLERIAGRLRDSDLDVTVVLDDVSVEPGYYTGVRFRIYGRGIRPPIASGGRYDALYSIFGVDLPATGFTLSVDLLEDVS